MKDKVSVDRIAKLHPAIRKEAIEIIEKVESGLPKNMAIRVVQGLRTFKEQNDLYAQGRTKPGRRVTNAKGGQSNHNYGLALDFAILLDKDNNGTFETLSWDADADLDKDKVADWLEIARAFKAAGWAWGGDFKSIIDKPHVEKTFGRSWKDLIVLVDRGYVDCDGYVTLK